MTGVGQLPCTDTPSPIPRLTSPDAHMSHSLSLSLWELQHGCPRGSSRARHGRKAGLPGAQKDPQVQSALLCPRPGRRDAPGTAASPRTSTPSPCTRGCLRETVCSQVQGQESPHWLRESGSGKHSTSTAGPSPTPHFCPGLLSNGAG